MRPNVAINFNLNIEVDNLRQFVTALNELTNLEVAVGIPEEKADRKEGEKGPANNAMIGYVQNYGFPALNIPARNFMETGIKDADDQVTKELLAAADEVLDGKSPKRRFARAGFVARDSVKRRLRSNLPPKLNPRTIKAREARGVTRTNTLVDTGQLLNSVQFVVQKRSNLLRSQMNRLAADERRLKEAVGKAQRP